MTSVDATTEAVRKLFYYPFDCDAVARAHDECVQAHGWRRCKATRDAMDACVEPAERQRFFIDVQCKRAKRWFQSCLIEARSDCAEEVARLHECALAAVGAHRR
uniref:Uncharacterized protein n=1 Tax=Haptolina brevifila TaxID=156173 RepID=A0A7S2DK89_9EUKA|eukprot:CAMPEP_0174726010 /NCGR_PEP_ID=MMETSP1094-20130205/46831_1 /TAXON_ID=156173 /ORGANISM="Chrysochromulina brevifilum, Strain UTEX LB 985" /LENGTH=103 /DNA_ID=CAMNT_0015927509 /DNA_START=1 /DNA_END=312 /DNA_ORIENTATION=+